MEIWKDVVCYEGYYVVSNLGNVKSVTRQVVRSDGVVQTRKGVRLKWRVNQDGYPVVKLSKDGVSKYHFVHRLVAEAFIDNADNLPEVNHIDFNRMNPSVDNLEWITHKDNTHYTIDAGRHHCNRNLFGENNPNYGSTTLKEFYATHPEEKKKLERHGSQNGMSKPITVVFSDGQSIRFNYIRECAKYLIDNGVCSCSSVAYVADEITRSMKKNKSCWNCHFSRD